MNTAKGSCNRAIGQGSPVAASGAVAGLLCISRVCASDTASAASLAGPNKPTDLHGITVYAICFDRVVVFQLGQASSR